jgi:hypothetical protein
MGGAITHAMMRIYAADASLSRKDVIYGDVSSVLIALGAADPRLAQVVPYTPGAVLKEDDVLIIALKGDAADALDSATVVRVPVTIKNMTTGIVRAAFLTLADFRTMAGAAIDGTDISVLTSWTDVMKYTVGAQERLILGHKFAENSRIHAIFADT